MSNIYKEFTNLYPVSKTLKFELIPQAETLDYMTSKGLIKNDIIRAEEYQTIKGILDEYHKNFVNRALEGFVLNDLNSYFNIYTKEEHDENDREVLAELEKNLRKQISTRLKSQPEYKTLFKADLIKTIIPDILTDEEEIALVKRFSKFTTYFTGYHKARENMYTEEEKYSSIAYRVINENLRKFINNIITFGRIKNSTLSARFSDLENDLAAILQVESVEEMFEIEYFNQTLSQRGIDVYNHILNGYSDEKMHYRGLNNYIVEYNQKVDNPNKLPVLQPLFKQILSDKNSFSFSPDAITTDQDVLDNISFFWNENKETIEKQKDLINQLISYDPAYIYIKSGSSLKQISYLFFGERDKIQRALNMFYDGALYFKAKESFSIKDINAALLYQEGTDIDIRKFFKVSFDNELLMKIAEAEKNVLPLLENSYPKEKKLLRDQKSIDKIKDFLDAVMDWLHYVKLLCGSGKEADRDSLFYSEFDTLWDSLNDLIQLYNRVRNYLTRKPYSNDKIKLNFNSPALLSGWSVSKEESNLAVLLLKDEKYYLGIMDKGANKIFAKAPECKTNNYYRKMEYKLLPGANKMLPKVFLRASKNKALYNPSEKILEIYESGSFKKGDNFNLEDCHALIDFFKESIRKHPSWSNFNHKFSDTSSYEDISAFYREVEEQGYSIDYKNIDAKYIDKCVKEGRLYLFQLYNKDFSENKRAAGTENLFTMYWKMLFDEKNLEKVIYKLNGDAEIFYRPASLKNPVVHKANETIKNKNPLNKSKESLFTYDIIKDKRYTVDKFFLHVPLTLNFSNKRIERINKLVRETLHSCEDVYVIGIKRAERHLLSYCVINGNGQIIEQGSLDNITSTKENAPHKTDYNELLSRKKAERDNARKNWASIENIKELKEGYLSQVIHKLTQLMVKYNAVIVLEDLSVGFVKERQKIEKQIYQKFEKKLIDKLSFLVDKKLDANEEGGLLKAYQLSQPNYKGNQSGFVFFVQPAYTTQLDPTTGFTNQFYVKYTNRQVATDFFSKFKGIKYNSEEDYFEFDFDYTEFTYKLNDTKTNWTVCTNGTRVKTVRNKNNGKWEYETVNLTREFKTLFERYGVDVTQNLKSQIIEIDAVPFYKDLMDLFALTVQMKNNELDEIHIVSPVKNTDGDFFTTKHSLENIPNSAATLGAYNIARKGLCYVERIKEASVDEVDKVKMSMKNTDWLNYMQQ